MPDSPPVTTDEAREALRAASATEARATEWIFGRHAYPHLILWGLIWMAGYGATAYRSDLILWPWLVIGGSIASFLIGFLMNRSHPKGDGHTYIIGFGLIMAFAVSVILVLQPTTPAQSAAFPPLLVGLIYGLMGLAPGGRRLLLLGVAITVLTLVGYFRVQAWFSAWMAVVGGGGLVLGGLWLRRI